MLGLSETKIDLWYLDHSGQSFLDDDLRKAYVSVLNEQESQRYERLQISARREQFLLGRFFLRQVLSRYHPIAPLDWRFSENEHGKPELANDFQNDSGASAPLAFNLSHSRNMFFVAVSAVDVIGVDVEYSARSRRIMELAQRHFSADEIEQLQALKGEQQLARFYHVWTLKEAYVKARGLGLTMPLQDFSLHFKSDSELEFSQRQAAEIPADRWQFLSLGLQSTQPVEPYTVSVAVGSTAQDRDLRLFRFTGPGSEQEVEPEVFARTV